MAAHDPELPPDAAAIQFMVLDILEEILKFSEDPSQMAPFLARRLREFMGARGVLFLEHGPAFKEGASQIVALEPGRLRATLPLAPLLELAEGVSQEPGARFLGRPSASSADAARLDALGLASLSLTPLRIGELRLGTLFGLDHLDTYRTDDIVRLLSTLSPIFALILRNTSHYQAQEARALAQAEEYRALLRTNLDGFVLMDGRGRILDANEAYLRMSGYTGEEIRTLAITNLDAEETPVETAARIEHLQQAGYLRFRACHRRKNGSTYPVEVSTTHVPGPDHFIAFIRDLTEREAAEQALRTSEAHHRELVEVLGEGVSESDPEDTFVMANPEAERIFGVAPGGLPGRNLREFVDEEAWRQVSEQTRRRLEGRIDTYQLRIRRDDGARRVLHVTATPRFDGEGRFQGSLGVFRDITDELKTQEALRLAQKMESLGNLAGGLAHDMNNVLGAILSLSTLQLSLQPQDSPLYATFQTITRACERGRNMVKGLLDFARKDMAGPRRVSLSELVQAEVRLLERTIPANIRIRTQLDPSARPIQGDPDALSLVVMNLCVNALDAMPDGGSLALEVRSLPGHTLLSIADTGMGMPPDVLERALEPFFTTKPQGKGTGLGLSQAYSTVQAHHGTLEIRSQPSCGTTIELRFPSMADAAEPESPGEDGPAPSPPALKILLVDDDELIRAAVSMQLELLGHEATLALCGEEALSLLESGLQPTVVILDMNMPGWGGAGTLPRIRALRPDLPVLLSTGRADQQAIDLARGFAGVSILPKPYTLQEIKAAFAALLSGT